MWKAAGLFAGGLIAFQTLGCEVQRPNHSLDPAAWGEDHVGQPPQDFVSGDECLFCHRQTIGSSWQSNRHNRTTRAATASAELKSLEQNPDLHRAASKVQFLLGAANKVRYLKGIGYGRVALLKTRWEAGKLNPSGAPQWDEEVFADSCAGCHTTAVDPGSHRFSALALDCYSCHGDVDLHHSSDPETMLLSGARRDAARVVISICAQCHVRSGRSRSSGLPYPNGFVAGDNLFRDFEVDFSDGSLAQLSLADRHVLENIRDVVVLGKERVTCLSCHNVHTGSSASHSAVRAQNLCSTCHISGRPRSERRPFTNHSETCER